MATNSEPVKMELQYALPSANGQFYRYMYKQPGRALGPGEFMDEVILPGCIRADPSTMVPTPIHNARLLPGPQTLKTNGFKLLTHENPIGAIDLTSGDAYEAWCHSEMLPKVSQIAKAAVEESYGSVAAVHVIDYALRATDNIGGHLNFEPPVMEAHADFTPESGAKRVTNESVKFKVGDQSPIKVEDNPILVNVWQPVVDTVFCKPLVCCDLQTLSDDDLVTKKMLFEGREGQVYNIKQNDNQKWYYYPHMRSTEALCFTTWLPDGTTVAHSGAKDPSDPVDSPPRRSMEVRFVIKLSSAKSMEPSAKKARTDKSIDDWSAKQEVGKSALDPAPADIWQLLYWPAKDADGKVAAGAGRAEYLRVIFEEAGIPYEEVTAGLREYFWNNVELQPFPVLAPPAIRKGSFVACQTAVCAKHLAVQFGMYPVDAGDACHADQIVATVHEYIAEGRMAFHPVKNTMSYHDQKEAAKPYIEAFAKDRLPRYMSSFERLLKANLGGDGFFIGDSLTHADLQVMVMLQVTRSQFPDSWLNLDAPLLKAFLTRMEARPKIKSYLQSDRRQPFAGDSLM